MVTGKPTVKIGGVNNNNTEESENSEVKDAVLNVEEVKKTYKGGEEALKGVDIAVHSEEFAGLIGLSGAGKSTLLRCINRLVEPDSGKIFLEEVEITSLSDRNLKKTRRRIGMIFQEFNLVERLTALQNILSGRLGYVGLWRSVFRKFPNKDLQRARELAELLRIEPYLDNRADALSGGQRQRVGICRALIQEPDLLLVDEPTSSLDPAVGKDVMEEFKKTTKEVGVPTLCSIHDIDLALEFADSIIAMKAGVKIYEGRAEEVNAEKIDEIYAYEV